MKNAKVVLVVLAIVSVLGIVLPLAGCSCGPSFPYQGTYSGAWNGQLQALGRSLPVGGSLSLTVDSKGAASGTVSTTGGSISPANIKGQVDSDGNLNGTVSFIISGTTFNSNWQGKISGSGNALRLVGNWTSDHGAGTFSGNGNSK
jgi:hypothetical protein